MVIGHYQGSIEKALLHLYPDIGLEVDKFTNFPRTRNSFNNIF